MTFITNQCKSNFHGLKGKFTQKKKENSVGIFSPPMLMERQMKFCSPLNICVNLCEFCIKP